MIIHLRDYLHMMHGNDATAALFAALEACRGQENAVLKLGGETLHFYPHKAQKMTCFISNNDSGEKAVIFPILKYHNLTIDGEGATLLFHGSVLPFVLDRSENICLKNFTIDYPHPQYFQARITAAGADFMELTYDPQLFGMEITDDMFRFFCVEDNWEFRKGRVLCCEFDHDTRAPSAYFPPYFACVKPGEGHPFLKQMNCHLKAIQLAPGHARFEGHFNHPHTVGNAWVCTFAVRDNPGIFCNRTKNLLLQDVTFHAACSMGLICQLCENVTMERLVAEVAPDSGRYLSVNADATHFVNCNGVIRYEDCRFTNMLDDAGNIHGNYLKVTGRIDDHTLRLTYGHPQQRGVNVLDAGDKVYLVDNTTLSRVCKLTVKDTCEESMESLLLITEEMLPEVRCGFTIENYTKMPELYIHNCITGHNRPRGFLLNTWKKTVVENNTFFNMSYGIHIAGDCNSWFESGPVEDILIRGNHFKNSAYTGGPAIAVEPNLTPSSAVYHKGIVIEDNLFEMHEERFLMALGVENLVFRNNRFIRNKALPSHPVVGEYGILLGDSCADLLIEQPSVVQ